jgi:AcrR family transcriptional regulator
MVEAVARHGFAGTTVRELVGLAGVSKSTFYDHFASKQDCFLATFDAIIAEAGRRVGEAYRSGGSDFRERLTASLTVFANLAVDDPAAVSLTAVESLTLGAAAVESRERAARAFEALIQQSFDHSPSKRQVSEMTVRAIVAGIRGVTYRHARSGRLKELPKVVGDWVDWALRYQEPDSKAIQRAIAASERTPADIEPESDEGEHLGWDEAPDSRRSRSALTQRERIIRAAAKVAVERGYEALSIPAISGAAGVSNETFYEHFSSKRDAFLVAFETLGAEALRKTAVAFEREKDRPEAIGAGLRVMLEHIATNDLFARLAFFELPVAGPEALDRADAMLDSFAAFLALGDDPQDNANPLPDTLFGAVPSGAWAVIQYEIAHGRRESLPAIAPELLRIVMAAR